MVNVPEVSAKSIINSTKSKYWFGYDFNMNIYRGCNHGCIYCDSRSECYRIEHFDTVMKKENALQLIQYELKKKTKKGIIGTGAMSDPYNFFEKEELLTRNALMLINQYGFGVGIATKSGLITRDIDILKDISKFSPAFAKITITTIDDELGKIIEPFVSTTTERFNAINQLSQSGVFCGVLLMPILPFINDTKENILGIIRKSKENGAKFILPAFGVTLRTNQRNYFYDKLDKQFPDLKAQYIKHFADSYNCNSPNAMELECVFVNECEKLGMLYKMEDIIYSYKKGYEFTQMSLF